ncbi:MAG: polyprenyl synthetase family protein [Polyangiaceae bacterium]|nr:polyprenyl synthetase family protein [Polyangiaceae bacterium]MCW5791672.1 polyprenyl synthetase family protein [Polyangiaceae bacterium]
MALLGSLKRDIDARLAALFEAELKRVAPLGQGAADMVLACRDLCLRGGKRVRPGLVVAGLRAVSATREPAAALEVGVALELVQGYFLIHDDWMDRDLVRRGGPSVHAQLTRRFRSEHLGAASAILAGDFAVAVAQRLIAEVPVPPRHHGEFLKVFAEMQVDAVLGQQLDLLNRADDPELTYALKTASYTVRGPLLLGALLGGARPAELSALSRFARPAGVAFQLRDDLLGVFGRSRETGKPRGSDLARGSRTPLILAGLRRARGEERQLLQRVHGNKDASLTELERAIQILESSGARAEVEARIQELEREATSALSGLRRGGHDLLLGAVSALGSRRS